MKAAASLALFALALTSSACITTSTVPLAGAGQLEAIAPEYVAVFATEEDIPGPYDKIAIIHARGSSSMTDEKMMMAKLQQEAAELGANGIVVGAIEEPSAGAKVAGAVFGVSPQRKGEILAVRYRPKPTYSVHEDVGMDTTFYALEANVIGVPDYSRGIMEAVPGMFIVGDSTAHVLYVAWGSLSPIGISDTSKVIVQVDERRFTLAGEWSQQESECTGPRKTRCVWKERLRAPIAVSDLLAMAGGRRVIIRLAGPHGSYDGAFSAENIEMFTRFVEQYVKKPE